MRALRIGLVVVILLVAFGSRGTAQDLWGSGSPDWGAGSTGPGPVIFKFAAATGVISRTFAFDTSNWMWIGAIADSGRYLYASHNTYDVAPGSLDTHNFKIAKIDRFTGAVLSDTSVAGFLGQTFSQINALDFHDGHLYAVENATSGSTIRGYALEILLDANGDVTGAVKGAFVGPYPDCGLDFHDGLWYATSWGYTLPPTKEGSIIYTSPDIMNVPFTKVGTGNSAVQGIGMIDGWEFDEVGQLFAVTWYDTTDLIATEVYTIDLATRRAVVLYDLGPSLPAHITWLSGLSDVVFPVATSKDGCKDGGWQFFFRADRTPFKNQGDCIQYVNTRK